MASGDQKESKPLSLRQQVLVAALQCSEGSLERKFTAEDLLLTAWKRDPLSWGLRAYERDHPDSEKIYTELDRASVKGKNVRGGLVGLGLFEKVRQRTYRLTPKGLAEASAIAGSPTASQRKIERAFADVLGQILSHPVFVGWQRDHDTPKYFRDAGHFWGVAPGTPTKVIRARILAIDDTLEAALSLVESQGGSEISERRGKVLFDRADIECSREFQAVLKKRFARDLETLGVCLSD